MSTKKTPPTAKELKAKEAEELKAKEAEELKAKEAEELKAEEAEELKAKAARKPPYYMAPGKSITSRRGIRGPGDEVRTSDLHGGRETVRKFVKSGYILRG